jgi:hypothetical protein
MKIIELPIPKSPKLKEYQEAFQKGWSKLNPAQKKFVGRSTLKGELKQYFETDKVY